MYNLVSFGQETLPQLTPAEQAEVKAIVEIMPDCYTQELSDCLNGRSSAFKHCQELTERYVWLPNEHPIVAHVKKHLNDNVEYCHESDLLRSPLGYGLIAGALCIGIAVGILIPVKR